MTEPAAIYDLPDLYDLMVPPGPCEAFYLSHAQAARGAVLDLACGTGRLTIPLARAGVEIVGLDASAAMLGAARRKAAEAGVACEFVQGDMRRFDLGRRFAMVMVSCNSLGHMLTDEDLADCLRCIREHLAPGGSLILDVVNPDLPRLTRAAREEVVRRPRNAKPRGLLERTRYDEERRVVTIQFSAPTHDGVRHYQPLRLRRFFPDELARVLTDNGLRTAERFGGFGRQPLRGASAHQVIVAGRSEAGVQSRAA